MEKKFEKILKQQHDWGTSWLDKRMLLSDKLPSKRWYSNCKNRDHEICRDWEFEGIYDWFKFDNEEASAEYSEMVNSYRKRMGLGGNNYCP